MSEHCSGESRVPRAGGHAETKLFAYCERGRPRALGKPHPFLRHIESSPGLTGQPGSRCLRFLSIRRIAGPGCVRPVGASPRGTPRAAGPRTQRGQIELSGGRHGAAPRPLGPSGSTNDSTRGGRHVWARRGAAGRWPPGPQASRAPPSGASAHGRFLRGPFLGPFEAVSPSRPCLFCSILLGNGLLLLLFFSVSPCQNVSSSRPEVFVLFPAVF